MKQFLIMFLISHQSHAILSECDSMILDALASDISETSLCRLNVFHRFLSVSRGFVSGEQYQIIYECVQVVHVISATFAVLAPDVQSMGDNAGNSLSCGGFNGIKLDNISNQQNATWIAPAEEDARCVTIIAFLKTENQESVVIKKEFCRNPGCYHIYREAERNTHFTKSGPISCWLFFESLPENNVYLQILSYQHTNSSNQCFGLMLSVDETESSFTGPVRFCKRISHDNASQLYQSNNVISMRYHLLESDTMYLQFRYFNHLKKGCNRTFTGESSGQITSPNYPDDYYPGLDCYYVIKGLISERIVLHMKHFSIQDPDTTDNGALVCNSDYISVVEGVADKSLWCGSFANSTLSGYHEMIQSSYNVLIIHFHTDLLIEAQGFMATWKVVASCRDETITNLSGVITSINYPDNYLHNQLCTKTIQLPTDYGISIEVTQLHLQPLEVLEATCHNDGDYVQIADKKYCGQWPTNNLHMLNRIFQCNEINITFFSNVYDSGPGFRILYHAVGANKTSDCRSGWLSFEEFCFEIVDERKSWNQANQYCNENQGHLVIVATEQIHNFLNAKLNEKPENSERGFWLGATDLRYETDFTWLDGSRVNFTKWFPGWPQFGYYNKQPNDDGLSSQNCLEMRRKFYYPSKGFGLVDEFNWNDISCTRAKPFICQYPKDGAEAKSAEVEANCNNTFALTATIWHATIVSPGYPNNYGDFLDCYVVVDVPDKSWMILEFTKFTLEPEQNCVYDYFEISEESLVNDTWVEYGEPTKLCGDWSFKLKLLRRIVATRRLVMHFHTDHSRGFGGYHANVYMEDSTNRRTINVCNDKKLQNYKDHCYLFISFPTLSWDAASKVCNSSGGYLASSLSWGEQSFFVDQLLRSSQYTSGDMFWLGGRRNIDNVWTWTDGNDFNFTDWFSSSSNSNMTVETASSSLDGDVCLSLKQQFQTSDGKLNSFFIADRPYWIQMHCSKDAGYICKIPKPIISEGDNRSLSVEDSSGILMLPTYPIDYPNNLDYTVYFHGQPETRVLITFALIDTEYQEHCLYDYLHLRTYQYDTPTTYCGHVTTDKPNYASYAEQAILSFHSDYSIGATGFVAEYQIVNISNCHVNTEVGYGYINSVNFPRFYLNALDCETTLRSESKTRILLDFVYFDVGDELAHSCQDTDYVTVYLDGDIGRRVVKLCGHLNAANESRNILYVSYGNVLKISFHSDATVWGVGYRAWYQTLYTNNYTQTLSLKANETTELKSINYPRSYPPDMCIDTVCRVPYGYQVQITFDELYLIPEVSPLESTILLNTPLHENNMSDSTVANFSYLSSWNRVTLRYCGYEEHKTSIRRFKATIAASMDASFWTDKALQNYTGVIDACYPNPCYYEAPCLEGEFGPYCKCSPSYLGIFCHFSFCDFKPCVHGKCEVTNDEISNYVCICDPEYTGKKCEFQIHPCASNPCQNGDCHESLGVFTCLCFEGYKGDFCEKKALFEAKTLRESFIRDPFWLGLFMILGVMSSVGIVNCCRKRWADTKMALLCNEQAAKPECRYYSGDDKDMMRNGSCEELRGNDDDSEVYFNFSDLGIDPSQYNSLLQIGDVNFKMKLSDLNDDQLKTLENYLENYLKSCEQQDDDHTGLASSYQDVSSTHAMVDHHGDTGVLVDLGSPKSKPFRELNQRFSSESNSAKMSDGALNLAFDSITDLILKSAEIVRPNTFNLHDYSPKQQRHSVGGAEHMQKIISRKADVDEHLSESKNAPAKRKFRGAAQRAIMMVKRPQSEEIPAETHEEMRRLYTRGASSFSVNRAEAFDEESCA